MGNIIDFEERTRDRKSNQNRSPDESGEKGDVILFTGVQIQYQKSLDRVSSALRFAKSKNSDR